MLQSGGNRKERERGSMPLFVARLFETPNSHVVLWKQFHLNQHFVKLRHREWCTTNVLSLVPIHVFIIINAIHFYVLNVHIGRTR
jgi:hypothetical protein